MTREETLKQGVDNLKNPIKNSADVLICDSLTKVAYGLDIIDTTDPDIDFMLCSNTIFYVTTIINDVREYLKSEGKETIKDIGALGMIWCFYTGFGIAYFYYKNNKTMDRDLLLNSIIKPRGISEMDEFIDDEIVSKNGLDPEHFRNDTIIPLIGHIIYALQGHDNTDEEILKQYFNMFKATFLIGTVLERCLIEEKDTIKEKPKKKEKVVWRNSDGKIECPGDYCPRECGDDCPIFVNTKASSLMMKRQYDEAIPLYEKILGMAPDYYDALNNMSVIYGTRGDYQRSYDYSLKAHQINPERPSPIRSLMFACRDLKKYEECLCWCDKYKKVCDDGTDEEVRKQVKGSSNVDVHKVNDTVESDAVIKVCKTTKKLCKTTKKSLKKIHGRDSMFMIKPSLEKIMDAINMVQYKAKSNGPVSKAEIIKMADTIEKENNPFLENMPQIIAMAFRKLTK